MPLEVARRYTPRVHRQNLVVKAGETPLVRGNDLRFERAVAAARHLDGGVAEIALDGLLARTVARVAAAPGPRRRASRSPGDGSARSVSLATRIGLCRTAWERRSPCSRN